MHSTTLSDKGNNLMHPLEYSISTSSNLVLKFSKIGNIKSLTETTPDLLEY
jgi:hypothetical protein